MLSEEIRQDDRVWRAEQAIVALVEEQGIDALFGDNGRMLNGQLAAVRMTVALEGWRREREEG